MGVSLMLRCGSGSVEQTWTGARGAAMTPSSSRRSVRRKAAVAAEMDGARDSWPLTHCPHPRSFRAASRSSSPGSGPSINGARLPDLGATGSAARPSRFHRRVRRRSSAIRRGLSDLDLPLAESTPCFFSIPLPPPSSSSNTDKENEEPFYRWVGKRGRGRRRRRRRSGIAVTPSVWVG
ncbi:hypothetical protein B296_00046785 [Ensete ventricosum]|uniref:Uncharacterized protein n=1 Tax=Ensete ventricosum TaxID=4639 RepID=A0A426X1R5_ENSVE|nr:hypothetical protein B296_00046785 [Ensete ventricosum]